MNSLIIWGASGHALVVADIIRLSNQYHILCFLDDVNTHLHKTEFCKSVILGGSDQLSLLKDIGVTDIIVGIGNCGVRQRIANFVKSQGFNLISAIHPRSTIATNIRIGEGTVIAAGAVVNPGVKVGNNVIINTSSSVDHECIIEDGVHIGPGVHIGGRTTIKQGTWIGIGATVSDSITIGSNSIIGAGSVVVRDIPPGVVAYGVPAKVIRPVDCLQNNNHGIL